MRLHASQMMPPAEVAAAMKHPEMPPDYPCGPNTNFQNPTPMPFRFDEGSLPQHNLSKTSMQRPEHPIYQTSSSDIGRLTMQGADMPMRWYGLKGQFTTAQAPPEALPKTRVNTGLNTAMDRSNVHPTFDQGWSGHLGLTDFNIGSLSYAKQSVRQTRTTADFRKLM